MHDPSTTSALIDFKGLSETGAAVAATAGGIFAFVKKWKANHKKRLSLEAEHRKALELAFTRIEQLERDSDSDHDFRRIIMKSQMIQMEAFIILFEKRCEECPVKEDKPQAEIISSIRATKRELDEYLRGLI